MKVARKSLYRSKNGKLWKKRANQRTAKERKRLARAAYSDSPEYAEAMIAGAAEFSGREMIATKRSGFRVIIICHDDGERVQFDSMNGPHGLTISPTLAGRKLAMVFANYKPLDTKNP